MSEKQPMFTARKLTSCALLAALSTILMFLSFSVPLMPSFIKLDFSELPALLASFALGPVYGIVVCLVKNLVNVFFTTTGGIGELSNFLLGASFVGISGVVYHFIRSRKGAFIGSLIGAAFMAGISVLTNYFIVYPIYFQLMPQEVVLGMYQVINPHADTLLKCLLWFNMPFTFIKGMLSVAITFLIYKKVAPILQGRRKER